MTRLLSNKSPLKKILKPDCKTEKKSFVSPKPKSEDSVASRQDEMSSWEYYNSLMMFGKRKMAQFEWIIWKDKKDKEDFHKKYIMNNGGRYVKRISSKEFNWRFKKDPDFDERFYMTDNKLE